MSERTYTKRKFLALSFLGGVAIADQMLKDGIFLEPPPLALEAKRFNLAMRGVNMNGDVMVDLEDGIKPLRVTDNTYIYYNTDDELIFQHTNASFDPQRYYQVPHRSGNRKFMVDKAIKKGANGFDLDATCLSDGQILAEHGRVGSVNLGIFEVGGVFDLSEKEVRTRIPKPASELFDYIGSKSNPEDPFVVSVELKNGQFDSRPGLFDFISGVTRNGLPTRAFSPNQTAVDNLYGACQEYSKVYGPQIF